MRVAWDGRSKSWHETSSESLLEGWLAGWSLHNKSGRLGETA